jgi:hypothetical protein
MLYVFGPFHISRSLGISDMASLRKNTKWKYLQWSEKQYKVSGYEIKMTLEDLNVIDNG